MTKKKLKEKIQICAIRKGANTIREFCKRIGVSESRLSLIINGKKKPSMRTINKIIEKTKDMGRDAVKVEDFL